MRDPQTATGNERLLEFCKQMGFRTLTKRVEENLSKAGTEEEMSDRDNIYSANISYSALKSEDEIKSFISKIDLSSEFCFDTETTGLDKVSDKPIGISLSVKEFEAAYIPLVDEHLNGTTVESVLEL